jgi:solute carrier family 25 (mitochondrial carnitine/acylcarnitine transporter), member 20/29
MASSAIDFLAGTIAGFCGLLVSQPFDTIKVRQQTSKHAVTALSVLYGTLRHESCASLYRGLGPPLASTPLINALTFAVYARASSALAATEYSSPISTLLAGSAAGATQAVVRIPVENVKIKLQLQHLQLGSGPALQHSSSLTCLLQTLRLQGPRGLLTGSGATLCREVPSFGVYFSLYEALNSRLQQSGAGTAAAASLAGGLAGMGSWALVFPVDTIKTAQQSMANCRHPQAVSMAKKAAALYREAGVARFYRGLSVCMIRAFSVNAVIFPVYELASRVMQQQQQLQQQRS